MAINLTSAGTATTPPGTPPTPPTYTPTHYVSTTGTAASWAEAESPSTPASMKDAVGWAVAGDVVKIAAGTYIDTASTLNHAFEFSNSGTALNPIVWYCENRGEAVFEPNATPVTPTWNSGVEAWAWKNGKDYHTVDGVKIQNGGIHPFTSTGTKLLNIEVTGGWIPSGDASIGAGIRFEAQTDGLVQNCYVHSLYANGNNSHNSAAIQLIGNNYNCVVEYCTADSTGSDFGCAFGTKGGATDPNGNTWRYNFGKGASLGLHLTGNTTSGTDYTAIGASAHYNATVHNNVFLDCGYAFDFGNWTYGHTIYNNTSYGHEHFLYHEKTYQSGIGCNQYGMSLYNNIAYAKTSTAIVSFATWRNLNTETCSGDAYWDYLYTASNYNQVYGTSSVGYAVRGYSEPTGTVFNDLADWKSNSTALGTLDANSLDTDPSFVNLGGTTPADYKRTSYPTNGAGGSYPTVMGAYVNGTETIGYTA